MVTKACSDFVSSKEICHKVLLQMFFLLWKITSFLTQWEVINERICMLFNDARWLMWTEGLKLDESWKVKCLEIESLQLVSFVSCELFDFSFFWRIIRLISSLETLPHAFVSTNFEWQLHETSQSLSRVDACSKTFSYVIQYIISFEVWRSFRKIMQMVIKNQSWCYK